MTHYVMMKDRKTMMYRTDVTVHGVASIAMLSRVTSANASHLAVPSLLLLLPKVDLIRSAAEPYTMRVLSCLTPASAFKTLLSETAAAG